MINEAISLSIMFFKGLKKFPSDEQGKVKAPEKYKLLIMENFEQLLNGGESPKVLAQYMKRYSEEHPSPQEVYNMEDILNYFKVAYKKSEVKRDPNNLLEPGKFYFHPALQVAPPPPVVYQLDDGTFKSSYDDEPFFLEIKESFTWDDLVGYFYKVMELDGEGFKDRDMGAFKHIMKGNVNLDLILYTIDEARFQAEDVGKPRPKNPFDIRDYMDEGATVLEDRMNTCYMEGLDHVIPRASK
jgi:hypothetical protein